MCAKIKQEILRYTSFTDKSSYLIWLQRREKSEKTVSGWVAVKIDYAVAVGYKLKSEGATQWRGLSALLQSEDAVGPRP